MPHDVTMPQLGMAQDTGIIVGWLKSPGDVVKVGDILMEVETDKASMEVEAAEAGFLTEVRAQIGVPVPVGSVIAVISEMAPAAKSAASATLAAEPEKQAAATHPVAPAPKAEPAPPVRADVVGTPPPRAVAEYGGRILASPKARYEAHRRGIDLTRLARQGVPQPFHVKDLDRVVPDAARVSDALELLEARAARSGFDNFAAWAADVTGGAVGKDNIWMSFVSGAWRRASEGDDGQPIVVEFRVRVSGKNSRRSDADLVGVAATTDGDDDAVPDLVVHDLTASALTGYRPSAPSTPVLVISDAGETYALALSYRAGTLSLETAATFLQGVAERAANPLRNLL